MSSVSKIIEKMKTSPQNVRFSELSLVCEHFFGEPRNKSSSHHVYKTPWYGDPRVNIQESKGEKAKLYQVKQVLAAIDRMEENKHG